MDINVLLHQEAAKNLNLECRELPCIGGIEIKVGSDRYYFRGGETPFNTASAIGISANKYCFNKLFESENFPVVKATAITKQNFIDGNYSLEGLKFPMVVKPTVGTGLGEGVICNVQDKSELLKLLKQGFKKHSRMSIEEFHRGLISYRVLVLCGDVIGVIERIPAHIVGDGKHTIAELIELTNKKRKQLKGKMTLGMIDPDDPEIIIKLKEMKLSFDHIPKKNKRVMLCYRCNATCGGTTHSLGHQICTENYKLLVNAAKVLSLDLVGFDVLCEDINVPLHKSKGVIIESNHNPDLSIHEHPMSGPPVKVCEIILKKIIQRKWRSALKYYLKTSPFKKHLYIRAAVVIAAIFVLKGIVNLLN